jgi:hypothetical protein
MKEKECFRKDQTPKLGKSLSMGEEHIYRLIHSAGTEPMTTDELYEQHFGVRVENSRDRIPVWLLICRARQKLGEHSIISLKKPGHRTKYLTRRALIETSSF